MSKKIAARCPICLGTDGFHGLVAELEGCPRGTTANTIAANYGAFIDAEAPLPPITLEWLRNLWALESK